MLSRGEFGPLGGWGPRPAVGLGGGVVLLGGGLVAAELRAALCQVLAWVSVR